MCKYRTILLVAAAVVGLFLVNSGVSHAQNIILSQPDNYSIVSSNSLQGVNYYPYYTSFGSEGQSFQTPNVTNLVLYQAVVDMNISNGDTVYCGGSYGHDIQANLYRLNDNTDNVSPANMTLVASSTFSATSSRCESYQSNYAINFNNIPLSPNQFYFLDLVNGGGGANESTNLMGSASSSFVGSVWTRPDTTDGIGSNYFNSPSDDAYIQLFGTGDFSSISQTNNSSNVASVAWGTDLTNPTAQALATTFHLNSASTSTTVGVSLGVNDGRTQNCGSYYPTNDVYLYSLSSDSPTATASLLNSTSGPIGTSCVNNNHQIISISMPNGLSAGWYMVKWTPSGVANTSFSIEGTSNSEYAYEGEPYQSNDGSTWTSESGTAYLVVGPQPSNTIFSDNNTYQSLGMGFGYYTTGYISENANASLPIRSASYDLTLLKDYALTSSGNNASMGICYTSGYMICAGTKFSPPISGSSGTTFSVDLPTSQVFNVPAGQFTLSFGLGWGPIGLASPVFKVSNIKLSSKIVLPFAGSLASPAPVAADLQQYKSDDVTPIATGTITTDATTTFKTVISSPQNLLVKMTVDVIDANSGNIVATSSGNFVPSGSTTSVTINLPDGSYRWKVQAIDANGATSTSTYFNSPNSTDLIVKLVPLITQTDSAWAKLPYGNGHYSCQDPSQNYISDIKTCGCAISDISMLLQYHGIDTDVSNLPTTPDNLNAWLTAQTNSTSSQFIGYKNGDVDWGRSIEEYAKNPTTGIYRIAYQPDVSLDVSSLTSQSTLQSILNGQLSQSVPLPTILKESVPSSLGQPETHYVIADGIIESSDGGSLVPSYTIKDPFFENTKHLIQSSGDLVFDYQNQILGLRAYEPVSETGLPEEISYTIASPAELLITDPQGRRLGNDPVTGINYNEITDGSYITDGIGNPDPTVVSAAPETTKTLSIENPTAGQYTLQVIGTGTGSYTLYGFTNDVNNTPRTQIITGNIISNLDIGYSINFNSSQPQASSTIPQDTTPPTISHTSLASQYLLNSTPISFAFNAIDTETGVYSVTSTLDGVPISSPITINFNHVGSHTIVISASDFVGNSTSTTINYSVDYGFGGFLPPVEADGTYKQGRAIPVKFQLTDANNNFISTVSAHLFVAKMQNGIAGTDEAAISKGNANIGNAFRYDPTDNQYIFNLDTSPLAPGLWQFKIVLDDGTSHTVVVSIK